MFFRKSFRKAIPVFPVEDSSENEVSVCSTEAAARAPDLSGKPLLVPALDIACQRYFLILC